MAQLEGTPLDSKRSCRFASLPLLLENDVQELCQVVPVSIRGKAGARGAVWRKQLQQQTAFGSRVPCA